MHEVDGTFCGIVIRFHVPQVGGQSQGVLEADLGQESHGQFLLNEFDFHRGELWGRNLR